MKTQSENLTEQQLSEGPVVHYTCKASGDFGAIYISDNVIFQLGYQPQQFLDDSGFWLAHIHPEDRDRVLADLAKLFVHDRHAHEYRFLHANGQYRWMRDEQRLLRDAEGAPERIVGYWTDINDRKEAERELAWSNAMLAAISRSQEYYIQHADPKYMFEQLLTDLLGLADSQYGFIGELLERPDGQIELQMHAITHPVDDAGTVALYEEHEAAGMRFGNLDNLFGCVVRTGAPVIANDPASDPRRGGVPPGHPQLIRFLGLPVTLAGATIGIIGLANRGVDYDDALVLQLQPLIKCYGQLIEALRRDRALRVAQDENYAAAMRLKTIFANTLDGLVTVTVDGRIESINPAGERIFGYDTGELIGKPMGELMTETHRNRYYHYLGEYMRTGVSRVIGSVQEIECVRKGGEVFPVEVGLSEVKLARDRYFIAAVRDVSERRRLAQMKDEFISVVSHELRTPLTAIRAGLGLLHGHHRAALPAEAHALVDIAQRNAVRLAALVDDLLDMEKTLSGTLTINRQVIDVAPVVEEALRMVQPLADQYRVTLRLGELVPSRIMADPGRAQQVLVNLLSNAAKYSPEGGEVLVTVSTREGMLRVSVRDDGPGVPSELQARIFEKFVQVDGSSQRQRGGTGLGLSIAKALVESMDGRIGLESLPGKGSTFFFELPLVA